MLEMHFEILCTAASAGLSIGAVCLVIHHVLSVIWRLLHDLLRN